MTGIPGWVGRGGLWKCRCLRKIDRYERRAGSFLRRFEIREFSKARSAVPLVATEHLRITRAGSFCPRNCNCSAAMPEIRKKADEIRAVRDAKYPPSMKCAGSIFKNLLLRELPESVQARVDPKVVREGKVPSAWFLEQVGQKDCGTAVLKSPITMPT